MVRKSETLKSLAELNLSAKTFSLWEKRSSSLEGIIWHGRCVAYSYAEHPERRTKNSRLEVVEQELVTCLEKAGFIRKDINPTAFRINRLYKETYYQRYDFSNVFCSMDGFDKENSFSVANRNYESFMVPSAEQVDAVMVALKLYLPEKEFEVISYCYGFEDGVGHNRKQAAERLSTSHERVRQIEARALRRLRRKSILPSVLPSSDKQKMEADSLIKEIDAIHQDPIFQKEAELVNRLLIVSKMPFDCANVAKEYFEESDPIGIEQLDLSIRAYNCLKRAGINTIADIIDLPKEEWSKIRYIGSKSLMEVEEKIHSVGYVDFKTALS